MVLGADHLHPHPHPSFDTSWKCR